MNNQSGRVMVITGATGVTGEAVARRFADQGNHLALLSSNSEKLNELAARLTLPGWQQFTFAADLTQTESASRAVHAVMGAFNRIDILVHLVGGWAAGKTVVETSSEEVQVMLNQHFWSSYYIAQAVLPIMLEKHWGRFIVVSSPAAVRPPAKSLPYTAAKAAQETLVLTMAQELKGSGVTANIIQVHTIDAKRERISNPAPKNAAWATPEEIAAAISFLCSEEASQINGTRLPITGNQ